MLNKHDLVMTGDPVTCLRPDGTSPILLMCDHASRALPEEYGDLGLPKEVFDQHVAAKSRYLGAAFADRGRDFLEIF